MTLQPAAGSQGELTGLTLMRAYFADRGEQESAARSSSPTPRTAPIPPRVAMAGFTLAKVKTDSRGNIDVDDLRTEVGPHTAGLMLTNPSTLGLFEEHIEEIAQIFHDAGALLYYDGANLNAVCGISRPGDMGFDIMHFNLHKTFSQPHGGGGPGAGPVAVRAILEQFLPTPVVVREGDTLPARIRPSAVDRPGARASPARSGCSCARTPSCACGARACATCPRSRC